ncbi:hypothetical protein HYT55_04435 [Candidatus Woesearchaeota archaeon]|nr:hypothetical protein [Candidatus Woesearchaeota archaeon]
MMKRHFLTLLLVILLLLPSFSLASAHGTSTTSGDNSLDIGGFVTKILSVGSLSFLGSPDNQFIGFIRILMAVLIFTLLYLGLSMIPGITRGIGITIGILLAIMVSVFMPADVLIAWGTSYATLFAFVIVFGPVIAGGAFLLLTPTPSRGAAGLKIVILFILWWLVAHIADWAHKLGSSVGGSI